MASPQNSLKLIQTNPYPTQNQNLDRVFRGALILSLISKEKEKKSQVWGTQSIRSLILEQLLSEEDSKPSIIKVLFIH